MKKGEKQGMFMEHTWEILSGLLTIYTAVLVWVINRMNDTYTKKDTKEILDYKVLPLIDSLERHSNLIERQTQVFEKLNDSILLLHIDLSVVKVKVESLEARPNV